MQLFLDLSFCLWDANCSFPSLRYIVMSGTPEKILEHFLETMRLEVTLNEATGTWQKLCRYYYCIYSKLGIHCNMLFWKASGSSFSQKQSHPALRKHRKSRIRDNNPVLLACSVVFILLVQSRTASQKESKKEISKSARPLVRTLNRHNHNARKEHALTARW